MKFTLNWNITTYEATAMGGCEAPTILTSSMKKGMWPGNVARYRHFLTNIPDLLLSLTNISVLLITSQRLDPRFMRVVGAFSLSHIHIIYLEIIYLGAEGPKLNNFSSKFSTQGLQPLTLLEIFKYCV